MYSLVSGTYAGFTLMVSFGANDVMFSENFFPAKTVSFK